MICRTFCGPLTCCFKLDWSVLPTYDPEGDSYEGVNPPEKTMKWNDPLHYKLILTGPKAPELSQTFRNGLSRGHYGGVRYKLSTGAHRDYSKDPRKALPTPSGSGPVLTLG